MTPSRMHPVHPPLPPPDQLFGCSAAMAEVRRTIEAVAPTDVPVLIQGESGTGKELCARWLHQLSGGTAGTLVKVSCPAIPQGLVETELFGYEKGAFTGAQGTRQGRVEQADGGTLLLDEIGSLDLAAQAKLLHLLQDGSFTRVGSHEVRRVRTRLLSLANRDLKAEVHAGTFRLDLLYRINALSIQIPPLRQRLEDLPALATFFLERHALALGTQPAPLSGRTLERMRRYRWPGNIRQLENLMRSYALIGSEESLAETLLFESSFGNSVGEAAADMDLSRPVQLKAITRQATRDLEQQIILKVLRANGWNRLNAARWLGISYRSLLYKLGTLQDASLPEGRPDLPHKPQGSRLFRVPAAEREPAA